jgi:hypothetical protein
VDPALVVDCRIKNWILTFARMMTPREIILVPKLQLGNA